MGLEAMNNFQVSRPPSGCRRLDACLSPRSVSSPRVPQPPVVCVLSLGHVQLLLDPMDCIPPVSSVHGKNIGVGCHFYLQSIFPDQGLNLHLLYCRRILYRLNHQWSTATPGGKLIGSPLGDEKAGSKQQAYGGGGWALHSDHTLLSTRYACHGPRGEKGSPLGGRPALVVWS